MKPCAFADQSLKDHAEGSVKEMLSLFDDSYFKVVMRRLSLKYSPDEMKSLVTFLTWVHDIGKAAEYYQRQFDDNCRPLRDKKTSFRFHELGGALFLFYNDWSDDMLKMFSVLSVLNHLNAMRGLHNLRSNEVREEFLKLERYGKVFLSGLKYQNPFMNTYEVRDYKMEELQKMVNYLKSYSQSKRVNMKGYVFLLVPIIIGDNLDSSKNREKDESFSSKSRFIQALLNEVRSP
ncbi:MAG: HD domain-containing protein [Sulfolobaceae archaeon]|nr:HD domain-containing protein [Sulfolobaceae archaeon]